MNNLQITKLLLKTSKLFIKIGPKVKIKFVKDRPGHDLRYALDSRKIRKKLFWKPKTSFKNGLKNTFLWYLNNLGYYKKIPKKNIFKRLGTKVD